MRWHLIPNVVRSAVNTAIYQIPLLITIEATLSFLEFGFKSSPLLLIPPTLESWGDLIGDDIGNFFPQWWHVVVPSVRCFSRSSRWASSPMVFRTFSTHVREDKQV